MQMCVTALKRYEHSKTRNEYRNVKRKGNRSKGEPTRPKMCSLRPKTDTLKNWKRKTRSSSTNSKLLWARHTTSSEGFTLLPLMSCRKERLDDYEYIDAPREPTSGHQILYARYSGPFDL